MFSQLRRVPLRRCLHSQVPHTLSKTNTKSSRLAFTLAATVISYSTWRWTTDQRIALDSATVTESIKSPALDGPSSETHHTASTTPTTSVPSSPSDSPNSSDPTLFTKTELDSSSTSKTEPISTETEVGAGADAQTEAEASEGGASDGASQGAYNPVTGEINWDCPCLGGMAHGPCGPEFREAFSCFVFSEEEPKGINCVEKFQGMQNCFRAHPEVYADEIMDDEEADGKASDSEGAPAETETTDAAAVAPPTEQSPAVSSESTSAPPPSKKSKLPSSPQKSSA